MLESVRLRERPGKEGGVGAGEGRGIETRIAVGVLKQDPKK